MANLKPAMDALGAIPPAAAFAALKKLRIWWWEGGEQRVALDRWKTPKDLSRALAAGDPWLAANAIRIVAEVSPAAAAPVARALAAETFTSSELDELAGNQVTQVLWEVAHHLPLDDVFALDAARSLAGVDAAKVVAAIPAGRRAAALSPLLAKRLDYRSLRYQVRELLALETLGDPKTLRALAAVVVEDGHPAQERAAAWLYQGGSEAALRALVAYLDRGGKSQEVRAAAIGAAARLGAAEATRALADLAADKSASRFERATCFSAVADAIELRRFPKDDPTWIRLGLAAARDRRVDVAEAARRMLGAMHARAAAAAAADAPAPQRGAGRGGAARAPRRAAEPASASAPPPAAWLDGFEADLRRIVSALREHGYGFAARSPIVRASKTAKKSLDAFERKHGVLLPWSLRAFWERFASVDLREDVDAEESSLPELGRCDPLVVVSLAEAARWLDSATARHAKLPKSARPRPSLYLAPDPLRKYDPDGEEPDERPLLLALASDRRVDADVASRNVKPTGFLSYLRSIVAAGGFQALTRPKGRDARSHRAKLTRHLEGW
ncbi:MAG: hypothetical protein JNL38_33605 [Myxococcales bacterium]|nr:hypothetical protein [Myxococcales bacterium]